MHQLKPTIRPAILLLLAAGMFGCARQAALEPVDFGRAPRRHIAVRPLAPPKDPAAIADEAAAATPSIWPVDRSLAKIISPYGARRSSGGGGARRHRGIDLKAPRGTPVHATAEGSVTLAGRQRGYGKVVRLSHHRHTTGIPHEHYQDTDLFLTFSQICCGWSRSAVSYC